MEINFDDFCVYGPPPKDGKTFVGIKIENNSPKVYFPYGYRKSTEPLKIQNDILNLIDILASYIPKIEGATSFGKWDTLPVHAYINVYTYFFNKGYFVERQQIYKKGNHGKIDWGKTIKLVQPMLSQNKPIYLEYITQSKRIDDSEIITQIHKHCLIESYKRFGFLFGFPNTEKPTIPFNRGMFLSILKLKISHTFNENDLLLFQSMVSIIESIGNETNKDMFYGTFEFHHIWETLINETFGIQNKKRYNPHYQYYKVENGHETEARPPVPLKPDTIMKEGDDTFILDAKFYRFGVSGDFCDVPEAESITKQMAYAEFVENKLGVNGNNIYNAFILPYPSPNPTPDYDMEKKFSIKVDWKPNNRKYETIDGIVLDTKTLMYRHKFSSESIRKLAEIIRGN